jgi:catechol 2,3-dioxygenase-like lactoylglutathione lyase family enzyme
VEASAAPPFEAVLETALYYPHGDKARIERFYGDVLGLRRVAGWDDGTAYRVGSGVLLLFDLELLAAREGPIPDHGAAGPGHACLLAPPGAYEAWRERLRDAGIELTHEQEWNGGRRSFYFRDPAGNLLEVADSDIWPR